MKKERVRSLLAAESAVLLMLVFGGVFLPEHFSGAAAFPFEQVGSVLRWLSLLGGGWNTLAWVLYFAVCLLPLAALAWRVKKGRYHNEDSLLILLSVLLFFVIWQMINPAGLPAIMGTAAALMGKSLLGLVMWSAVCCYGVLVLRRTVLEGGEVQLDRWLFRLVACAAAVFVLDICAVAIPAFVTDMKGNDLWYPLMRLAVSVLPDIFGLLTADSALTLLETVSRSGYSQEAADAAKALTGRCSVALAATVLTELCWNLYQLIWIQEIENVNITVNLPLMSMAFFLGAMLLARLIEKSRRLQEDNDLFI